MAESYTIEFLADYPFHIPFLENYFETQWPGYYGPEGSGNAGDDLRSLCHKSVLPIGLIAVQDNRLYGSVALRPKSASHEHLKPWVTSLFIVPHKRSRGIGLQLIQAVERLAISCGYDNLYTRSATARDFFLKNNWEPIDKIGGATLNPDELVILKKNLRS